MITKPLRLSGEFRNPILWKYGLFCPWSSNAERLLKRLPTPNNYGGKNGCEGNTYLKMYIRKKRVALLAEHRALCATILDKSGCHRCCTVRVSATTVRCPCFDPFGKVMSKTDTSERHGPVRFCLAHVDSHLREFQEWCHGNTCSSEGGWTCHALFKSEIASKSPLLDLRAKTNIHSQWRKLREASQSKHQQPAKPRPSWDRW